jgi:DNA-binding transcriptional LysR family regulator
MEIDNHLDHVFEAVTQVENRSWKQETRETLRIAATSTLAHHFLVPNIIEFRKVYPDIKLSIDIRASHGLWEDLLDGRYDLSITTSIIEHAGLTFHKFHESHAVCVLPDTHELAKREVIAARDLHQLNFIALPKRLSVRIILDQILAKHGIQPNIVLETSTGAAACAFVQAGIGAAVINPFPLASKVANRLDGIVFKPFVPAISYSAAFVSRGDVPPSGTMRKFMKFVRNRI